MLCHYYGRVGRWQADQKIFNGFGSACTGTYTHNEFCTGIAQLSLTHRFVGGAFGYLGTGCSNNFAGHRFLKCHELCLYINFRLGNKIDCP